MAVFSIPWYPQYACRHLQSRAMLDWLPEAVHDELLRAAAHAASPWA
jgi:hypothetical protein